MKSAKPFLAIASLSVITLLLLLFSTPTVYAQFMMYPSIQNPRLARAFIALQAWKHVIVSDPKNVTENWCDPDVCNYTGVFCAPAPDDTGVVTVAGIDLNHANITGELPEDLGLLTDLALFHVNSNRFYGTIPWSFRDLHLLFELDVSNNLLSGEFPSVVLDLPSLRYLDIRFNLFEGDLPQKLFDLKLDALFINNNFFSSVLPPNIGNSPVSVIVIANNPVNACLPASIMKMASTLTEIIISNAGLTGCLPPDIGVLNKLTVFDISSNSLVGQLPDSIADMKSLQQLNVAHNKLSSEIPNSICSLPNLQNFTYSDNYFCREPESCLKLPSEDDTENCIPERPFQRPEQGCIAFYSHPVDCSSYGCWPKSSAPSLSPAPAPTPTHLLP
ncbi:hypothetical protein MLD38_016936 [Melastoma candidum]|uniref:Uncharacterized protein n=1 Tax=Melastoma candidum TaxID=119954 RepID=A0ACB9QSI2_9MYRT|nr:hypothetical protein MLD38_016936 [Melastoma candidum]